MSQQSHLTFGTCSHRGGLPETVTRQSAGCEECLALGDPWVHLRMCLVCGKVGCCDSSKNKHAHQHADTDRHPVARSVEGGEEWAWCYVDERLVDVP